MGHFGGDGTLWGLVAGRGRHRPRRGARRPARPAPPGPLPGPGHRRLRGVHGEDVLQPEHRPAQRQPERAATRDRSGSPSTATRPTSCCCRSSFGLVALFLVFLRRGEFARRLLAMKASPAACVTLGLNLTRTKLQVFALSAAIAGLGGALLGAQTNSVSPDSFRFLQGLPDRAAGRHRRHQRRGRRPVRRPDLRRRLLHHPRHRPVADQPVRPEPGPRRHQPRPEPERRGQRDRAQRQGEAGARARPGRRATSTRSNRTGTGSASTNRSPTPTAIASTAELALDEEVLYGAARS